MRLYPDTGPSCPSRARTGRVASGDSRQLSDRAGRCVTCKRQLRQNRPGPGPGPGTASHALPDRSCGIDADPARWRLGRSRRARPHRACGRRKLSWRRARHCPRRYGRPSPIAAAMASARPKRYRS